MPACAQWTGARKLPHKASTGSDSGFGLEKTGTIPRHFDPSWDSSLQPISNKLVWAVSHQAETLPGPGPGLSELRRWTFSEQVTLLCKLVPQEAGVLVSHPQGLMAIHPTKPVWKPQLYSRSVPIHLDGVDTALGPASALQEGAILHEL